MKLAILLLNLIVLTACVPAKVETEITSGKINKDAPYEWSVGSFPRHLQISEQFTEPEILQIEAMAAAWETSIESKINFFEHGNTKAAEVSSPNMNLDQLGEDGVYGVYKILHWPKSLSGTALAVTQIFGRRYNIGSADEFVRIEHADILLNSDFYQFRTSDAVNTDAFDLRTVMLHEMGHFLGLGHKYGDTIMAPTIGPNTNKRSPTHIDISDLSLKYGITLFSNMNMAISTKKKTYSPALGDSGQMVKILIELNADGECVHKENGVTVGRHPANIK
jgi:hypothetical protein